MADGLLTEKEVLERLGISADELDALVRQGKIAPQSEAEGGERLFSSEQVASLASGQAGSDSVSDDDNILFDLDAENGAESPSASDDDLFDFDENLAEDSPEDAETDQEDSALDEFDFLLEDDNVASETSEGETSGDSDQDEDAELTEIGDLGEDDEADAGDFLLTDEDAELTGMEDADDDDGDLITEVVDVSEMEDGEEDILSDVLEDSGGDVSPEELNAHKLKRDGASSTQAATVDLTELTGLDDETEAFLDSEDPTSDITQLGDEAFEDEDVAGALGEEGDHDTDFGEDDLIDYGEAIYEAEEPFPAWIVILLAVVLVMQLVGIIYIVENTLAPGEPTGIGEALNIARFF